ncbi:MAG: hypothetical protein ACOC44_10695, partial [Promethearchaeia archaeon]
DKLIIIADHMTLKDIDKVRNYLKFKEREDLSELLSQASSDLDISNQISFRTIFSRFRYFPLF